ncbi:MAG TPA: hypothetical protein VFA39_05675 [Steroidobacteraceae bacterium]|nr:hypothetical protein [Steroidobacteraceae bacterium]
MHEKAPKDLIDCRRFFLEPTSAKHRQYEALRAYFVEQRPSREVARAFGYSPGSFQVLCHHFRRELDPQFFVAPKPGPRDQPKKSAARDLIVELRKRNYSVYEISETLKERGRPLSATAVREVLKAEVSRRCPDAAMRSVRSARVPLSNRWPMHDASYSHPGSSTPAVGACSCLCRSCSSSPSMYSAQARTCQARR